MANISLEHDTRSTILQTGQRIMSRKGFSAVGLTEILASAGVPKGSFYHYFESKDAFGEALLADYFKDYVAELDEIFSRDGLTMAERLMVYFAGWREHQNAFDFHGRCLAVKLGAEVSDLSESMRQALYVGTGAIIARLKTAIEAGLAEGSLKVAEPPELIASMIYQQWLGASVMVKIVRTNEPFDAALISTRRMLGIGGN